MRQVSNIESLKIIMAKKLPRKIFYTPIKQRANIGQSTLYYAYWSDNLQRCDDDKKLRSTET